MSAVHEDTGHALYLWCDIATRYGTRDSLDFSPVPPMLVFSGELSPFFDAFIGGIMKHEHASDQIVVLNGSTLPHAVTLGYDDDEFERIPLLSIDGVRIRNLADVAVAVESARGPLVEFAFALDRVLVLPLREGRLATAELMKEYSIAAPWSSDIAAELLRRRKSSEGALDSVTKSSS